MPPLPQNRVPLPNLTGAGARFDLKLYIYPDGHGNITGKDVNGNFNIAVEAGDRAAERLAEIWRRGRQAAAKAGKKP